MKKLLVIALLGILFSCKKKDKPQVLEGYIREYYSGKPLPNIRVQLYEDITELFGPVHLSFIAEIETDANGYYKFYEENGGRKSYVLQLIDPTQSHKIDLLYNVNDDRKTKVRKTNFNLYKITPVKVHVTNTTGKLRSYIISGNNNGFSSSMDSIPNDTIVYEKCHYGKSGLIEGAVFNGSFKPVLFTVSIDVSFLNPDSNYLDIYINK